MYLHTGLDHLVHLMGRIHLPCDISFLLALPRAQGLRCGKVTDFITDLVPLRPSGNVR